ncbi:MAG: peptidoglycan-binding protein [Hyphomicrobiaceae bacterium]|nr:peptidoglycan-binding protein [Hyphomicrobiaceae bacterium]
MLPRRAKIVLCACAAASAGVWWNVMHLQQGTRADALARTQRLGEAASGPAPTPPAAERAGPAGAAHDGPHGAPRSEPDPDVVRAVQRELSQRGYESGPADGLIHPVTRAAVMAYEHDHGLRLSGEPSESLLKAIVFGLPAASGSNAARDPLPAAVSIIRSVQQSLAGVGYPVGTIDGRLGEETVRAIRRFEAQHRIQPSGRISGTLLVKLTEAAVRQQRRAVAN